MTDYYILLIFGAIFIGVGLLFGGVRKYIVRGVRLSAASLNRLPSMRVKNKRSRALLKAMKNFFYIIGLGVTLAGLALFTIRVLFPGAYEPPQPITLTLLPDDNVLEADRVLELVNEVRQQEGVQALVSNPVLTKVAEKRVVDMIQNQYYAHRSPDGIYFYDLIAQEELPVGFGCENLNIDFTTSESSYVTSWLESNRGHRECLLNGEVDAAGYAVGLFSDPEAGGASASKTYVVVGIHAEVQDIGNTDEQIMTLTN